MTRLIGCFACFLSLSCTERRDEPKIDEQVMMPLASLTTKLTAATEAVALYSAPLPVDLIAAATAEDPGLRQAFDAYSVAARVSGGHAHVLVCTKDKKRALLEDVGCTARLDAHRWKTASACAFTEPTLDCAPAATGVVDAGDGQGDR